jgi:hypothetical protein
MKKFIAGLLVAVFMLGAIQSSMAATAEGRGGIKGFFVGCCWGIRTAGAYNEGKSVHWREWIELIPYVGAIWSGISGAKGVTTSDLVAQYGANYY